MSIDGDALVWIDLEMDGLDLSKNFILEIACIITDFDLKNIHEGISLSTIVYLLISKIYWLGPDLVIHHPKSLLDAMGPWCMEQHSKSGLVEQVLNSKLSMAEAETKIINFIEEVTSSSSNRKRLILAGNSVYVDRYFLEKDMPRLNALLDRSILDCSTLKELIYRFNSQIYCNAPMKGGNLHRALDDIRNSIKEFEYYKEHAFMENQDDMNQEEYPVIRNVQQYLVWININEDIIQCILTDSNLNIIDEIVDAKTNDDLMMFFHRNDIYRERTIVVAGQFLGSIRARLKQLAPDFNEFCHYRSIDVDVISLVCEKYYPNVYVKRPMVEDEYELQYSIQLLRFYRSSIFK